MKILNLYAGLGGNRKLWGAEHEVTAVEFDCKIMKQYEKFYPDDTIILDDAHRYLLEHFEEFDFIWSSPPCQSHTRMIRSGKSRQPRYPDLKLYEEILFLKHNFEGKWVVENVVPYYTPFLEPKKFGRHLIWSNFEISDFKLESPKGFIMKCNTQGAEELKEWLGIRFPGNIYYGMNHDPAQVLRNCVHPKMGKHILDNIEKTKANLGDTEDEE